MAAGRAAGAQVADLVQITTLLESETGDCYVGTAGADSTIFLRLQPGFTGCDTQDFNSNLCITRREFPGDQPNGTIVSFGGLVAVATVGQRRRRVCLVLAQH